MSENIENEDIEEKPDKRIKTQLLNGPPEIPQIPKDFSTEMWEFNDKKLKKVCPELWKLCNDIHGKTIFQGFSLTFFSNSNITSDEAKIKCFIASFRDAYMKLKIVMDFWIWLEEISKCLQCEENDIEDFEKTYKKFKTL